MPGIDPGFMCHCLAIEPAVGLVARITRKLIEKKRKIVREETEKLFAAGFIWEIKYMNWLLNVVLVEKKSKGTWRMCIDFADLNKVCPKDSYPLPNTDKLVEAASGYQYLSFTDAYSGYNQVRMHPKNEEKMAFMIDGPNYCYQVMPFGLKNVGAMYQRLIDKIF